MAHSLSREKRERLERLAAAADRATEAEVLTVSASASLGHTVRAQCLCNRSRIVDLATANRSWGARTWRSVLQEQRLVCSTCGRPCEMLKVAARPEPLFTLRRR